MIKVGDYVRYIGNIFDSRLSKYIQENGNKFKVLGIPNSNDIVIESKNNDIRTTKEIGMYDQQYWWVYMNEVSKIDDMEMFVEKLDELMEI